MPVMEQSTGRSQLFLSSEINWEYDPNKWLWSTEENLFVHLCWHMVLAATNHSINDKFLSNEVNISVVTETISKYY